MLKNFVEKFIVFSLIMFVYFVLIAGTWTQTFAQEINEGERESVTRQIFVNTKANVSLGRGGVIFPDPAFNASVTVNRIQPNPPYTKEIEFSRRWLQVYLNFPGKQEVIQGIGKTYIYFDLTRADRFSWDEGVLNIYYLDPVENDWVTCPSMFVENKYAPYGRLVCETKNLGLFGIGMDVEEEFSE
jgi:hypothetical protein